MAISVATPEQMAALGARFAGWLRAGDVITLDGELGAGKTTFTRGLGEALHARGAVTSPTFVLARTHRRDGGAPPLVHVDAYRLGGAAEFDDLDIDLDSSITVVEWARDLLDGLTDSTLSIRIDRPTGAAGSGSSGERRPTGPPGSTGRPGATGSPGSTGTPEPAGASESDEPYDEEPIEPRTVTVTARGPGWADRADQLAALADVPAGDPRDPH